MNKDLTPTQKITFSAMLTALAVISTIIAKTIPMGSFAFLRFSVTPALVIYASLSLGPLYGAILGGLADLIPAFLYPTGDYNFLITIVYVLLGILPWFLEKLTRHFRTALRKPYLFYVLLAVLLAVTATIFYATDWLDKSFGGAAYWGKPTILAVSFVMDVSLGVGLYFAHRYYEKQILEHPDIPSPNEIASIALLSEVVLMDFAKALAFWLFYNWISNNGFPLSYGFVLSMLFLGAPLDVLIITFLNSWLLLFTKRFIRVYGDGNSERSQGDKTFLVDEKNQGNPMDEEEKEEARKQRKAKVGWIIFFVVMIIAMVVCIVVIKLTQGPATVVAAPFKAEWVDDRISSFRSFSSFFD